MNIQPRKYIETDNEIIHIGDTVRYVYKNNKEEVKTIRDLKTDSENWYVLVFDDGSSVYLYSIKQMHLVQKRRLK
jgi:hypothetical protein